MPGSPTHPSNQNPQGVVVVGGGLAGIAAAVRLADAGQPVTLVETTKRLGGRATSFVDPASGLVLDNCQHVLMGCCTYLIDLYRRLHVLDHIDWHRRFNFVARDGCIDVLEGDDLPAPAHLAASLMSFKGLTLREKLTIGHAMRAMMRLGRSRRHDWHHRTFADWLTQQKQSDEVIQKFWAPICVSALNEWPNRCAADYALMVFQDGFLCNADAYLMGLSAVPLGELYDAATDVIEHAGGTVKLGDGAVSLDFDQDAVRVLGVELADGNRIPAGWVVSALPFDRLQKICPAAMTQADDRLARLGELRVSPILGIHLWFAADSRSGQPTEPMTLPHMALVDSPLQWVFNKGLEPDPLPAAQHAARSNRPDPSHTTQHLHGVISAAYDWVDRSADQIIAMAVQEIRNVLPAARDTELVYAKVVKEKRATFSCQPGVDALRPKASGAIQNLYLAGDWTQSGWPATMEGATRSGYIAANAMLGSLFTDVPATPTELPDDLLYRLFARH